MISSVSHQSISWAGSGNADLAGLQGWPLSHPLLLLLSHPPHSHPPPPMPSPPNSLFCLHCKHSDEACSWGGDGGWLLWLLPGSLCGLFSAEGLSQWDTFAQDSLLSRPSWYCVSSMVLWASLWVVGLKIKISIASKKFTMAFLHSCVCVPSPISPKGISCILLTYFVVLLLTKHYGVCIHGCIHCCIIVQ